MINFFLKSTELDIRTLINQILFYFRKIPVLKWFAPGSSYRMNGIKSFLSFFSPLGTTILSFGKSFITYGIYALIALGLHSLTKFLFEGYEYQSQALAFMVPLIALDISRFYIRDQRDKVLIHYSLFNVNPKTAILSGLIFRSAIDSIGKYFALLLVFLIAKIPTNFAFILILIEYFTNLIFNVINFKLFEMKIIKVDNDISHGFLAINILLGAIALFTVFRINLASILGNWITLASILFLGILSLVFLFKYRKYTEILLKFSENYSGFTQKSSKEKQVDNITVLKDKDLEASKEHLRSGLTGYKLINEIFFQRHRRILLRPIMIKAFILFLVIAFFIILPFLPIQAIQEETGNFGKEIFPFLPGLVPFVAYIVFFQESLTKTMFINCDQALMQYGFYRRPKDLLKMFGLRLKKLLVWNSISLILFIVGLVTLALIHKVDFIQPLIVSIQIISMWVFFSVHTLFIYYIFQPYNDEHELKHPIYQVINFLVYIVCYMSMNMHLSGKYVAPVFITVSIIYSIIALIMVYKKAPDTFKVRIGR